MRGRERERVSEVEATPRIILILNLLNWGVKMTGYLLLGVIAFRGC